MFSKGFPLFHISIGPWWLSWLERDTAGTSNLGCDSQTRVQAPVQAAKCQRISKPCQVDQSFGWDSKPRSLVPGINTEQVKDPTAP